jgi:hypothetical protein
MNQIQACTQSRWWTGYRLDNQQIVVQFLAGSTDFCLLQKGQDVSHWMVTAGLCLGLNGRDVKPPTDLHVVPRLRLNVTTPLILHMPSGRVQILCILIICTERDVRTNTDTHLKHAVWDFPLKFFLLCKLHFFWICIIAQHYSIKIPIIFS